MVFRTRWAVVSITDTERPVQFVTYALVASWLKATPNGSPGEPRSIVAVIRPVFGLMTVTSWPGGSSYGPVVKGSPPRLFAT